MAKLKDLIDNALHGEHLIDDAQAALDGALASQAEVVRSAQANVDGKAKDLTDARDAAVSDDRKLATALKGRLVYRNDADGSVTLFKADDSNPRGWTSQKLESEDIDVPDEPAVEPVPPGPTPEPTPVPDSGPGTEPAPTPPPSPEESEPGTPEPGQTTTDRGVDYHGKPLVV